MPGSTRRGSTGRHTSLWMTHDTIRNPIQAAEHEAEHLREIVEEGESEATLAIVIGTWIVVVVLLVAVVVTAALLVAYLVNPLTGRRRPGATPTGRGGARRPSVSPGRARAATT